MLELEVGISGFEGCVSFLGFPPRKPSWLRKPRTPRDARVTMPCAHVAIIALPIWKKIGEDVVGQYRPGRGGWEPKLGPKPYRKRSLCYRARAPAGPSAHNLARQRDGTRLTHFILAIWAAFQEHFALSQPSLASFDYD